MVSPKEIKLTIGEDTVTNGTVIALETKTFFVTADRVTRYTIDELGDKKNECP